MKINRYAFETKWKDYLLALEQFNIIELFVFRHIPVKRMEIVIKDKHD